MEQNAFGFGMMLENVKAQIEGKSLPYPGGFWTAARWATAASWLNRPRLC